jgi:hypothetical protein
LAPAGGLTVSLSSSDPSKATVPATVNFAFRRGDEEHHLSATWPTTREEILSCLVKRSKAFPGHGT